MSKRISQFLALLVVVACVTAVLSIDPSSEASAPQRASAAGNSARHAAIIAATTEVLKATSEIRDLPILRPVRSGAQSRADIEQMLITKLNQQMTHGEVHAAELTLQKFGLAPADFRYRPFIIKLLTEQVAGYYDPKARAFHLADWLDLEGQKPVMSHELTHALQDQHFNLRRFEKWPRGDSDAELAAHALVEGDATLAMTHYMMKNPLIALAFAQSLRSGAVSSEQFNQAPRALRETLIFPYAQGTEWTGAVYRRGGWSLVSKAFTRLPQSTEQILHPEKYFSYEQPVKVALPDLSSLLNGVGKRQANSRQQTAGNNQKSAVSNPQSRSVARRRSSVTPPAPDTRYPTPFLWRRIDYDVNGEWGYYLILDQFLKSSTESKRAAAGWAGDRYALYEKPATGQRMLAHVSIWDSVADAREFFDAYVKRTELRYPGPKGLDSSDFERQTGNSEPKTRNSYSWQTSEGGVVIELRADRVLLLEGIPEGVNLNVIMEKLSRIS